VQRCDRIVILEDGRIVEQGRRAVLAQDSSSRFSELLRTGLEQVLV
jgi:ATP-binding cassette subfamily B protein